LTVPNIADKRLGDSGAVAAAKALEENSTVIKLNLSILLLFCR